MNYKLIVTMLLIGLTPQIFFAKIDVTDSGKLYPATVSKIVQPTTIEEIQTIVRRAKRENKKISVAGARFSQGAQSNATNSINIDLQNFNKLIKIDIINKTVTLQPGMTWEQLQNILHPLNLSVKVMQSSNIFSIGGSASVNVHGRDLRYGPMIETINSCKIINASGLIEQLSRQDNPELFSLVIGGYGLFGIIVEIELSVIDNPVCYKMQKNIPYKKYTQHFRTEILTNADINLYFGRLNTIPGNNFLKEVTSISYIIDKNSHQKKVIPLKPEENIVRNQWIFNMYREHNGKVLQSVRNFIENHFNSPWENDASNSRNQLMRPYVHCLENKSSTSTDLLQEYFIPASKFIQFTDQLRSLSTKHDINLLNVTLRWVPYNNESFLSYAKTDMIAFVIYFITNLDEQSMNNTKKYSTKLIQACLDCNGTFYLPYQQFACAEELEASYPMINNFIQMKQLHDPEEIFTSNWYHDYLLKNLN